MSTIHDKIKERRESLDITQDELAKKVGYKSRSSINKIELGLTDIPQSKIAVFAKALETTPSYLMGWEDYFQFVPGEVAIGARLKQIRNKELWKYESTENLDGEPAELEVRGYAEILNVSYDYLMYYTDIPLDEQTKQSRKDAKDKTLKGILEAYHKLNKSGRGALSEYAQYLESLDKHKQKSTEPYERENLESK
jgi:transcriptional regulator with XRE-family HTH domain